MLVENCSLEQPRIERRERVFDGKRRGLGYECLSWKNTVIENGVEIVYDGGAASVDVQGINEYRCSGLNFCDHNTSE